MSVWTYKGKTITEWSKITGIADSTIRGRIKSGVEGELLFATGRIKKEKQICKCAVCGREFEKKENRKKGICCSRECAIEYTKIHHTTRPTNEFTCKNCGKTFTLHRTGLKGIFCSHECNVEYMKNEKAKKIEEKQKLKSIKILTSILSKIENDKRHEINLTKECKECGEIFQAKSGHEVYCSDKCRRKSKNRYHDRRLNKCKSRDTSIDLHKVYDKYNGICQMCGNRLNFDCDYNSDEYPSIDHIIPISKGGCHTWDNVQLLCRGCNVIKGSN